MERPPPPESTREFGTLYLRNFTRNVRRALPVAVVLLAASTAGAQQYVLTQPGTTRATAVQPTTYVTRPVTYTTQPVTRA